MRPYQIVATEKIVNRIVCGHKYKKYGSVDGGGYIWHTTGSGKTLTSFKTAILISKLEDIKKVMFVVDRKDLDYQTMKEYDKFQKDSTNSNTSTKILAEQLNNPNKKIIITTIQKLSNFIKQNKSHAIYNDEIVLVFDECHRSHFGEMHKAIKNKFNKYYMFGFTGTPIFAENAGNNYQTTESLFGEKLHTYTIMDAINDKNVLRFLVSYNNTVQSKNDVSDKKVENIDKNNALNNEKRISAIVNYILEHYKQKT
jgi:type I restriction enzyme R subunit